MTHEHLKSFIESAYEHAGDISPKTKGVVRDAVEETLDLLDKGEARVAEKIDGHWVVNRWLKKAILLSFRLNDPDWSKSFTATLKAGATNSGLRFTPDGGSVCHPYIDMVYIEPKEKHVTRSEEKAEE